MSSLADPARAVRQSAAEVAFERLAAPQDVPAQNCTRPQPTTGKTNSKSESNSQMLLIA